ncbi:NAD-dependent epimerase/dehydratase family protein [Pectinatus haikarae]|uniref:dTDP-glucose 4,6-dehydratase n=1 Tax=Pectinatus haikarae TaxID=349096 RepID=A0ABT9Y440_9FIRM|nr:NAD(P)-dependent oxidoreductase [Pectinatus haikarae]MDQ0202593.1 dTDP-glucose 4,6-dehydratase [Pectinatus haikarae]
MSKYIILGGAGFLGHYLVEKLSSDSKILVCDIKNTLVSTYDNCDFCKIDITKKDEVAKIPFGEDDIVIHLAANQYHSKVPREGRKQFFWDVNYKGTENVLNAMRSKKCHKLIYFSTDMTYGRPQFLPVTVNHPQVPFGPYGESKKASEDLCREYRELGFNITIFRPRMILGPGRLGVLKKLFKLIELNLPVPMIGSGKNCYQMISVFDCVTAVIKCIDKEIPNKEYNLGSDNPPTVYGLLKDLIQNVHSKSVLIKTNGFFIKKCLAVLSRFRIELLYKEQYEIADENYIVDIENAKKELEWGPQYSDVDMLYQAYKYYQKEKAGI